MVYKKMDGKKDPSQSMNQPLTVGINFLSVMVISNCTLLGFLCLPLKHLKQVIYTLINNRRNKITLERTALHFLTVLYWACCNFL